MRIPSFSDFSPEILHGDLRPCLQAVVDGGGDDSKVIDAWVHLYFRGLVNGRSSTNIPATLRSTGLSTGVRPMALSAVGVEVLAAPNAKEAARVFCAHLLREKNANVLLAAMKSLHARGGRIKNIDLQNELKRRGIVGLANHTTDHSTLRNWMEFAEILNEEGQVDEVFVKKTLGISIAEADELTSLPLAQQVFLQHLRRQHILEPGPFASSPLLTHCHEQYPDLFDPGQFAKKIRDPLKAGKWIDVSELAGGRNGGKSGKVIGTSKLLDIPIDRFVPDFEAAIPPELKLKLQTPLDTIQQDLLSEDTYVGGLALELLALRMVFDLGLDPRHFRLRSAQSAHAEVDLIAEGTHLMFSRWTIQCKRYKVGTKVHLADVAKEMGIAIFSKAHVVMMVTTSDFTEAAREYANEVTLSQPIQFVFVPGSVVTAYLTNGKDALLEHVRDNAKKVMLRKRSQPLPAKEER